MNYYRRYVGDYLRDTMRLTPTDHGVYGLMLDFYYAEERPLPLDLDEIHAICKAIKPDDRKSVDKVLAGYFHRASDGYHNNRADKEIATSQQARKNGQSGGRPPTGSLTGTLPGLETGTETKAGTGSITGQGTGSGHPPTTNHQPPSTTHHPKTLSGDSGFEDAWQRYPKRSGNNPKADALRAWRARLAESIQAEALIEAVVRYSASCEAEGITGTKFVMQAATFFGPSKRFEQEFPLPKNNGSAHGKFNQFADDRTEIDRSKSDEAMARRMDEKVVGSGAA
jgi:hypothetical protein